jgi:hypothetical protein
MGIVSNLILTKFGFIRKFRPKQFRKIDSSLEARAIVSYLILFDFDDSLNLSCKDSLKKLAPRKQESILQVSILAEKFSDKFFP